MDFEVTGELFIDRKVKLVDVTPERLRQMKTRYGTDAMFGIENIDTGDKTFVSIDDITTVMSAYKKKCFIGVYTKDKQWLYNPAYDDDDSFYGYNKNVRLCDITLGWISIHPSVTFFFS